MRTDHGTEFKGKLQAFFDEEGIVHQTSADYTPEQNGRAERLNKTIFEKVRAQLFESKLPHYLWAAVADTACFIRNCTPVSGSDVSPYEAFYGNVPDVFRMRVFGCKAYVHVPAAKRKKLDVRSEVGLFVGYACHSKAWRVYVVRKGKWVSIESRNARFDESCAPGIDILRSEDAYVEFDIPANSTWGEADEAPQDGPDDVHEHDAYADMPTLEPASDDEDDDFPLPEEGEEHPDAALGGELPAVDIEVERRYSVSIVHTFAHPTRP